MINQGITLLATAVQTGKQLPEQGSSLSLAWGIVLIAVALILFVLEILVPSAGVIAVVSAISLIAGIVLLFGVSTTAGLMGCAVTLFAMPFLIAFAIKIWPHTFIAKMITLNDETNRPDENEQPSPAANLDIGMTGRTLTPLRPVGTCLIDGKREECIASAGTIEKDTLVEIVLVDGMQIKVRPKPQT